jgi:hypothetical protein
MEKCENGTKDIPRFQYSWTRSISCDPEYKRQRMLIRKSLTAPFWKTLVVTSTLSHPCPDFVVKALATAEKEVEIRHTWKQLENRKLVWSGSVAFYKKWNTLEQAANYIVQNLE